jgi:hypothetical protein
LFKIAAAGLLREQLIFKAMADEVTEFRISAAKPRRIFMRIFTAKEVTYEVGKADPSGTKVRSG